MKKGTCRLCGCTEADCLGCMEKTGHPCAWTDDTKTLCTACVFDDELHKQFGMTEAEAKERVAKLTRREREVLHMMACGEPNRAIAQNLKISPKTLDIHRANLVEKTGARGTADLVRIYSMLHLPAAMARACRVISGTALGRLLQERSA